MVLSSLFAVSRREETGGGEVAQSSKYLLPKHKDLSTIPGRGGGVAEGVAHDCNPSAGEPEKDGYLGLTVQLT